jgi:hypothetical protein
LQTAWLDMNPQRSQLQGNDTAVGAKGGHG